MMRLGHTRRGSLGSAGRRIEHRQHRRVPIREPDAAVSGHDQIVGSTTDGHQRHSLAAHPSHLSATEEGHPYRVPADEEVVRLCREIDDLQDAKVRWIEIEELTTRFIGDQNSVCRRVVLDIVRFHAQGNSRHLS